MGHDEGGGEGSRQRRRKRKFFPKKKRLVYMAAVTAIRMGRRRRLERTRKKRLGTSQNQKTTEMRRIECCEARQRCFSTRRQGLFKEAAELCVLAGARLAVIVFSLSGKAFSFAHPSVNAVVERCCNFNPSAAAAAASEAATTHRAFLCQFGSEFERLREAVVAEARRRDELDAAARAAGVWAWTGGDGVHDWGMPRLAGVWTWTGGDGVHDLGMPRLAAVLASLERVEAEVAHRAREIGADHRGSDDLGAARSHMSI